MKKKIVSAMLVLTILLSSIRISESQAEAAFLLPFIPAIAETLVSLGEILILTTATVMTGYAVSESIDQSDVDYLAGKLNTATDAAGDWWRDIKGSAVRVDDPTVTLQDDIAMGKVINFYDYYQPEGGKPSNNNEPRKSKKIDVTAPVALGVAKVISDINGSDDVRYTSVTVSDYVKGLVKQYCLADYGNWNDYYLNEGMPFVVCLSKQNNQITIWNSQNGFYMTDDGLYYTLHNVWKTVYQVAYDNVQGFFGETSHNMGTNGSVYTDTKVNFIDNIIYSSSPLTIQNTNTQYVIKNPQVKLSDSAYQSVDTSKGFTITPTKELRDAISNAQPAKTTDDVVKLLSDADKIARANGKQVINVDIDGNTAVQQDYTNDTKGIIGTLKEFIGEPLQGIFDFLKDILNKILDAIKSIPNMMQGFIEWIKDAWSDIGDLPGRIGQSIKNVAIELFVPTSISLDNFKSQADQIIESKTGILSYPLVLLIKLGGFVIDLDNRDCILTIPKIEFKGYVLCQKTDFNFTQFVNRDEYKQIYGYYRMVSNFFLIMCVLWLAGRKIDKIMEGRQA